jgi:hypothetical protein
MKLRLAIVAVLLMGAAADAFSATKMLCLVNQQRDKYGLKPLGLKA